MCMCICIPFCGANGARLAFAASMLIGTLRVMVMIVMVIIARLVLSLAEVPVMLRRLLQVLDSCDQVESEAHDSAALVQPQRSKAQYG